MNNCLILSIKEAWCPGAPAKAIPVKELLDAALAQFWD